MMKKFYLTLLSVLIALPSMAFYRMPYEYMGQTLYYELMDREKKTVAVITGRLECASPATPIDKRHFIEEEYNIIGDVVIPETAEFEGETYSVTAIDWEAFAYCDGLTSVTIPSSVTEMREGVFSFSGNLKNITVSEENPQFSSIDGVLFNKDRTVILCCPGGRQGTYDIPASVTSIGNEAFAGCSQITSISIPNHVTSIGERAFYMCSNLKSVTMPESLTFIGKYAFGLCNSLTSISIPSSLTSIGNRAFCCCYGLISLEIPETITSIGEGAFCGCDGLTIVDIPNSVTTIAENAFRYCDALTSVKIPETVTSIGDYAFSGCESLTNISVSEDNEMYSSADGILFNKTESELICYPGGLSGGYIIPDHVTTLHRGAFMHCDKLTSITIPTSISTISREAFFGCNGLTSVTIPTSITEIDTDAFAHCDSLTSVTLPGSLTSLASYAFYTTKNLKEVYYNCDTPIKGEYTVFYCYDRPHAVTLYVPESAVEKCKTLEPWRSFDNIVAYEFPDSDISVVEFEEDAPCEIYTLYGVKIAGSIDALTPGIYLVRRGNSLTKIAVK